MMNANCGSKCSMGTYLFNSSYLRFDKKSKEIIAYNNCTSDYGSSAGNAVKNIGVPADYFLQGKPAIITHRH